MFFKQTLSKKALKGIKSERNVTFLSFAMAKKVSFCFSYNEEGIEQTIKSFTEFLRNNNIAYSGIGTVMFKTKKQIIHIDEHITVINKSDCNYYGAPPSYKTAKLFVNEFDIFVDFNTDINFIQTLLALKTNAVFKIGRISNESSPYDLVIEQNEENLGSMAFLNQVYHYLNLIKPA